MILLPRIEKHFSGSVKDKVIGIWGLAFKPRTDDIREAPALALISKLLEGGAKVRAFDPEAIENVRKVFGEKVTFTKDAYGAIDGADALVVCTEWNEFRSPDWERVKKALKGHTIFDGRNIFRPELVRQQGFKYFGIGKP